MQETGGQREIEYENYGGSQCCGQNDDDKDIGLDSTLSISMAGELAGDY
jgi:hypothetical protein